MQGVNNKSKCGKVIKMKLWNIKAGNNAGKMEKISLLGNNWVFRAK
jgi:hypothetical protein